MVTNNRETLFSQGWGRHSCILIDSNLSEWLTTLLPENVKYLASEGHILIISTYDCAVINNDFTSEPWVNVLFATPIDSIKKEYENGRNERKLHFAINVDGNEQYFEVVAASIFQFERNKLLELKKLDDYLIEEHASFSLKHWLAERFRRDVWPDAFNNSLKIAQKRLKNYYKRTNEFVSGIYLCLDTWNEKPEHEKYSIKAIVVVEAGKLRGFRENIRKKNKGLQHANMDKIDIHIINELKEALGDTVDWVKDPTSPLKIALDIKPENNLTLTNLREFRRLNPYALSDEIINAPMPAEMEVK